MKCQFCKSTRPATGYCCEQAELETLRVVADEVIRMLDSEVVSMGNLDVAQTMSEATNRLRRARSTRAA
jgi:hypothetical protein